MYRVGRFEVADRRQQLIVAIMSLPLIYGAALVFEALARLGWWRILARVQSAWSRSVLRVLAVRATIDGSEHLPDGPAILLPLHEGFLDVPLLMATGRSMRFIARDELFEWPQLGRVLRTGGHVLLPTAPTLGNYRSLVANARSTCWVSNTTWWCSRRARYSASSWRSRTEPGTSPHDARFRWFQS